MSGLPYVVIVSDGLSIRTLHPPSFGADRAAVEAIVGRVLGLASPGDLTGAGKDALPAAQPEAPRRPATTAMMTQREIATVSGYSGNACSSCGSFAMKRTGCARRVRAAALPRAGARDRRVGSVPAGAGAGRTNGAASVAPDCCAAPGRTTRGRSWSQVADSRDQRRRSGCDGRCGGRVRPPARNRPTPHPGQLFKRELREAGLVIRALYSACIYRADVLLARSRAAPVI